VEIFIIFPVHVVPQFNIHSGNVADYKRTDVAYVWRCITVLNFAYIWCFP